MGRHKCFASSTFARAFACSLFWAPCFGTDEAGLKFLEEHWALPATARLESGVQYRVLRSGDPGGLSPNASSRCDMHYVATLIDGTEVDSSVRTGKAATFKPEHALAGWGEALQHMREGDKWDVALPSELAYGEQGGGTVIPPGAVLRLEIELLRVYPDGSDTWKEFLMGKVQIVVFFPLFVFCLVTAKGGNPMLSAMLMLRLTRNKKLSLDKARTHKENVSVFLDVEVGGEPQRIEIRLFAGHFPNTCERFRKLCGSIDGEKGDDDEAVPTYKGTCFHRVLPGVVCQSGRLDLGSDWLFKTEWESGVIGHSQPGLVSMVTMNFGDSCLDQFAISCKANCHWDRTSAIVFGEVMNSSKALEKMEKLGSTSGQPTQEIKITNCGDVARKKDE